MAFAPYKRCKVLQDAIDDESVILVPDGKQVSLLQLASDRVLRPPCQIHTQRIACGTFQRLGDEHGLRVEAADIPIIACDYYHVDAVVFSGSVGDHIVDDTAIKTKDHGWVDVFYVSHVKRRGEVERSVLIDVLSYLNRTFVFQFDGVRKHLRLFSILRDGKL